MTCWRRAGQLGGRLAAWPSTLPDGTVQQVEHGFHGFFRQYYTWRIGAAPDRPGAGVPAAAAGLPGDLPGLAGGGLRLAAGAAAGQPARAAGPLAEPAAARPAAGGPGRRRDAAGFDRTRTYAQFDGVSAAELLDRLGMPDRARAVLFEVFGHSFFNREESFSAAELIMQFHFYFLGNPEGLGLDVTADDHGSSVWAPLGATAGPARRRDPHRHRGRPAGADRGRLAGRREWQGPLWTPTTRCSRWTRRRCGDSRPRRTACRRRCATRIAGLTVSAPYAVARFWTDRPVHAGPPGVLRRLPGADARLDHRLLATGGRRAGSGPGGPAARSSSCTRTRPTTG